MNTIKMDLIDRIFLQNRAWAEEEMKDDPDFFNSLSKGQNPDFFWIGCSDSRVPANQITNTHAGQIFVHRNVANLVVLDDINLMGGLQYAVEVLKVKHVIVCGHYGCGGVRAALGNQSLGLLDNWICHIKDVHHAHSHEIDSLASEEEQFKKLVELNVVEQTKNLAKTSVIQNAWKSPDGPHLHGWVYDLGDGLLDNLIRIRPGDEIEYIFQHNSF